MAVSRRDKPPKPEPKEKPKVGQYEGKPTPTGRATGSNIAPFTYPDRQGFAGQLGNLIGHSVERMSNDSIKARAEANQNQYDQAIERYNGAFTEIERQSALREIEFLQNAHKELQEVARTGASGIRALGAAFEDRSLLSNYGELSAAYPGEFTYQPPDLVGKAPVMRGRDTAAAQPRTQAPGTPHETGFVSPYATQQSPGAGLGAGSAMAAWQGIPGESYPAAQAITPRGGYSYTPPGMPMGGLADPYRGEYPGAAGAGAGAGTNYLEPYEGPDAGGIPGIPTPGFRGFRTYADLRAGLPEGDPGTVFSANEMRAAYDYQVSAPRALRDVMDRADTVDYFRGGEVQRVDLGQGIQDYDVRRDSYGNIRSYTPSKNLSAEDAMKIGR